MKKIIIGITIGICLTLTSQYGWRYARYHIYSNVVHFDNEYNGLKPGYSTLEDVFNKLGQPKNVEKTSNGKNYHFDKVIVNFSGKNIDKINSIQINNDLSYICPNGIRLNESIDAVRQKLKESKEYGPCFYDNKKGIFYWHDGKKITKIVLAYKAFK